MKQRELIEKMTTEEKAALLSGKNEWQSRDIPRLGIPSLFLSDGPHGIRKQAGAGDHLGLNPSLPATCFPTAATVAGSWDVDLGREIGEALGQEAAALGVHVLLGPGLNIKRSPCAAGTLNIFPKTHIFRERWRRPMYRESRNRAWLPVPSILRSTARNCGAWR